MAASKRSWFPKADVEVQESSAARIKQIADAVILHEPSFTDQKWL